MFRNDIVVIFSCLLIIYGCNHKHPEWAPVDSPLSTRWSKDVNPDNSWPEYPRPQFVRPNWQNLNGLWEYAIRPKGDEIPDSMDGKILVPFPVESSLSGVGRELDDKNQIWYRRKFIIPPEWKGQRVILKFEASDWETKIYLDSQYQVVWKGGYDSFGLDITNKITPGQEHELLVSVWDPTEKGDQPRGSQSIQPKENTHSAVSGIWQTVWLESVPQTALGRFESFTDIDQGRIIIIPYVMREEQGDKVRLVVKESGKEIGAALANPGDSLIVAVPSPHLWSPEDPFLYDLELEVKREGVVLDSVVSYIGMRKISLGKDENGQNRILLNNQPYFLRGVLDQGFWPDGLYTPPTDEALKNDILTAKKPGFNLIRKYAKVESRRFYYWCDKLGMLVWQDMPNADGQTGTGAPDINRSPASASQFRLEIQKMIVAHINHPSIVIWTPFTEGKGQFQTNGMVSFLKFWDQTRLINAASGWTDRGSGDILDVYDFGFFPKENRKNRALVMGKSGRFTFPVAGHLWAEFPKDQASTNQFETLYHQYWEKVNTWQADSGLSGVIFHQLIDVEDEVDGLVTFDREVVKINSLQIQYEP
ncbi:MAG: glycoside hydrolase family 2 TIM barrel-domain containing protein [Bacteroidia bacterium]